MTDLNLLVDSHVLGAEYVCKQCGHKEKVGYVGRHDLKVTDPNHWGVDENCPQCGSAEYEVTTYSGYDSERLKKEGITFTLSLEDIEDLENFSLLIDHTDDEFIRSGVVDVKNRVVLVGLDKIYPFSEYGKTWTASFEDQ